VTTEYTTKPAQFRLPKWAHDFIERETAERGVAKTEVVLEALAELKEKRFQELMAEGYAELAEQTLEEVREWDCTLMDGLEDEEW
jgi:riboflavin biosynthesis pyrimidine reductase